LNTTEFQARKTVLIDIIFAMKKISVGLFRAAPYMLMLEYNYTKMGCSIGRRITKWIISICVA
jgi:hypothetical protein